MAWQTALERDTALASDSTLCRLEQRGDRKAAVDFHRVLIDQFIASFATAPTELILDFDATDDRVHGQQEGRHYHGYYGNCCFLPLYVFCGEQLLVSYLRPSNIDAAHHAWAILKLLVARLRAAWPQVRLTVRADSGFCRWRILRWCERAQVDDIIGLARNSRLEALGRPLMERAREAFAAEPKKPRLFAWLDYAAQTWDRPRRVIVKAEFSAQGTNPRFVMTGLPGEARALYDEAYCARDEMEMGEASLPDVTHSLCGCGLFRFQGRHINGEAILHVRLHHSLVGFVNLLNGNGFHVSGDVVRAAEVEHLLCFGNAADRRTGKAATSKNQAENRNRQRLVRSADHRDVPVAREHINVVIDVVTGGNAIRDEVEAARVLLHLIGVAGNDNLVGTEAECVLLFTRRGGEDDGVRAECVRELHAHVTQPPEADDADLFAFRNAPMAHRRVSRDAGAEQRRGGGRVKIRWDAQHEAFRVRWQTSRTERVPSSASVVSKFKAGGPPRIGPSKGAMAITVISVDIICAARSPS